MDSFERWDNIGQLNLYHLKMHFHRGYKRLMRKTYRYLRHPRMRKYQWLSKLTAPLFDRALWKPCEETVATGLSVGLFCAMLPVPGQMLIAALAAVRAKANIPIAVAGSWVTNPLTQAFVWIAQERLGGWMRETFGITMGPLAKGEWQVPMLNLTFNAANFILGFVTMGIILSIIAYPLVHILAAILPYKMLHPIETAKALTGKVNVKSLEKISSKTKSVSKKSKKTLSNS